MPQVPLIIEAEPDDPGCATVMVDGTVAGRPYRFIVDTGAVRTQLETDEYTSALAAMPGESSSGTFASHCDPIVTVTDVAVGPLRFRAPEYDVEADRGTATWPIERGILVSRRGRGKGYLRISVERHSDEPGDDVMLRVSAEVANFYPTIAASWLPGVLGRFGSWLYRVTQLRIHVIVTNAFLRSLAELRLAPSVVGALRAPAELSA